MTVDLSLLTAEQKREMRRAARRLADEKERARRPKPASKVAEKPAGFVFPPAVGATRACADLEHWMCARSVSCACPCHEGGR